VHRFAILVVAFTLPVAVSFAEPDLGKAEQLFRQTEYRQSLGLLNLNSTDSATQFLAGRDLFMLAELRQATECFIKATVAAPDHSSYMDWLGRAYGRRAETSNPLSAPVWASKARQAFERAVQLDPRNSEALSDLFEFYLDAPGFLGGGYEKALTVAQKMAALDVPESLSEKARLEQKRNDFAAAEQHLRAAVTAAPDEPGPYIALSKFLGNQGRMQESEAVLLSAQRTHPNCARLWYARADQLIKAQRNLDEAKALLNKYVSARLTVDDPPRQQALELLKRTSGS
jgi:tetratricopeptide (TPR) repeat protein